MLFFIKTTSAICFFVFDVCVVFRVFLFLSEFWFGSGSFLSTFLFALSLPPPQLPTFYPLVSLSMQLQCAVCAYPPFFSFYFPLTSISPFSNPPKPQSKLHNPACGFFFHIILLKYKNPDNNNISDAWRLVQNRMGNPQKSVHAPSNPLFWGDPCDIGPIMSTAIAQIFEEIEEGAGRGQSHAWQTLLLVPIWHLQSAFKLAQVKKIIDEGQRVVNDAGLQQFCLTLQSVQKLRPKRGGDQL